MRLRWMVKFSSTEAVLTTMVYAVRFSDERKVPFFNINDTLKGDRGRCHVNILAGAVEEKILGENDDLGAVRTCGRGWAYVGAW